MITNNKLYDFMKYMALIAFPAAATLYFALSQIWGFGHGNEVVGSIAAFDTFLGIVLQFNKTAYDNSDAKYDGHVEVTETPDKKTFSLNVKGDPNDIDQKSQLLLKVTPPASPPVALETGRD